MYVGKIQNPIMVIVLSIVTCGIYAIYWLYTSLTELNKIAGKEVVNPILGAIIAPYGLYVLDKELVEIYKNEGIGEYKPNFILWIILTIVCGIGFYMAIYQLVGAFNKIWENRGATPPTAAA